MPPLTPAARRHIKALLLALAPRASGLERRFAAYLGRQGFDAAQAAALHAITPSAAARLGSVTRFLSQVQVEGRRLAKLNIPPERVSQALAAFDQLVEPALGGRFGPAREQLRLAASYIIDRAFYEVREGETQAFFCLYRAEKEARDFDDLLRRFASILARAFQARAGRASVLARPAGSCLQTPLYIERGTSNEEWILDGKMRGRHSAFWSFPLAAGAVVQFGFANKVCWLPREAALIEAAAARCREAAERIRLSERVRRLELEARRAEEDERRRIGRELHDEAGQSLLLLRLELEMMERQAPGSLQTRLAEARVLTERTIDEIRRIVAALSPSVLERLGLEPAIRQLSARFRKICAARLRMRIALPPAPIPPELQQVLYRIAQESLQNIAKHSQATHVNLSIEAADRGIKLSVSDNGAGFRTESAGLKPMSFGLAGMQDRAALLGGSLSIESSPGQGTRIRLWLPNPAQVESHDENSRTNN